MNDDRPDPHLRAALRHAPDADLQAPAAIGSRLRAAARAAIAADRPAPWWRRLWPSTPLRLGASGAFASVLLAGVIGLLWRGEPPPAVDPAPAAAPLPAPRAEVAPAAAPPAPAAPPPPRADSAEARSKALADVVQQPRALRAQREAQDVERQAVDRTASAVPPAAAPPPAAPPPTAEAMKAEAIPAPAPSALGADSARRAAAPAAAQMSRTVVPAAPAASTGDAWRRELDRVVGDRWRALDGAPPIALRRIGNAELGFDALRIYLCEDGPRRCREADLTADEAKRLRESLPP